MKNPVPRLAAVHDLSCFGRASLAVVTPILSTLGVQVCPLPTAILSTHTGGFTDYHFFDFTEHMEGIIEHWRKLELSFSATYSGFLGSPRQVDMVSNFVADFADEDHLFVVDPVLGDNGSTYGPMGPEMVLEMKRLVSQADVITPNFTEACLLLDREYQRELYPEQIKDWIRDLAELGPKQVVVTSVPNGLDEKRTASVAFDREDGRFWKMECQFTPAYYPGTGDAFASVIVGGLLQGDSLPLALERAVRFVSVAIRASFGYRSPVQEGVFLERVLDTLRAPVTSSSYEMME